jgi:hypothetical protein
MKQTYSGFCLCFLFALFCAVRLSATNDTLKINHRWAISASSGYGWSANKESLGSVFVNDSNNDFTQTLIRGTFGKGMTNTVWVSCGIKRHLGAELGVFANFGSTITTADISIKDDPTIYDKRTMQINSNGIAGGFYLVDTLSKIELAFHSDFLMGIYNQGLENRKIANPDVVESTWKYSGGMSYGWTNRISAAYSFKNRFKLGIMGFITLQSWSPDKRKTEKYTLNGTNIIQSMTLEQRTLTYSNTINGNSLTGMSSNTALRISFPLHAMGMSAFVSYSF